MHALAKEERLPTIERTSIHSTQKDQGASKPRARAHVQTPPLSLLAVAAAEAVLVAAGGARQRQAAQVHRRAVGLGQTAHAVAAISQHKYGVRSAPKSMTIQRRRGGRYR